MKEVKTKQLLMDFLRSHTGLEIVDRGAWFYAHYEGQDTEHAGLHTADYEFDDAIIDTVTEIYKELIQDGE